MQPHFDPSIITRFPVSSSVTLEHSTIAKVQALFPVCSSVISLLSTLTIVMDSIEFGFGSEKNIPLASTKEYMEMMIHSLEKFNKSLSWHIFFKLNPHLVSKGKETFGFNSSRAPPRLKELKEFEKDLVRMIQNIKFRKRSNSFLTTLKREIWKVSDRKEMIIPVDKTTNKYLVPPDKLYLINKLNTNVFIK